MRRILESNHVSEILAESLGDITNSELTELFDILADWEDILQAQDIDFGEVSPLQYDDQEGPQP